MHWPKVIRFKNLIKLTKKITKGEIDIKYGKPVKEKMFIVGDNKRY